jgi:cytochrome c556
MKLRIVIAVLCLLLGGAIGSTVSGHLAQRHQHARAVMWLAQIHLDRLATAARAAQCPQFEAERGRLGGVQVELLQAFPLAYAQDADFRAKADAFEGAVAAARMPPEVCAEAPGRIKPIKDACDACHHDYR